MQTLWCASRQYLAITVETIQNCLNLLPSLYWSGQEAHCGQTMQEAKVSLVSGQKRLHNY